MRRAHRVEAELLHQHEIGAHLLGGHDPTRIRIEVVPVDAAEEHGRAVEQELATADLHPAEPDPARRGVVQVAVGIDEGDLELVPRGSLRRP
jgi:hypothetical protein